jgi:hypothetical protein
MGHEMVKSCLGAYRHAVDPSLPESDEAALSSKTCTSLCFYFGLGWIWLDDVILHDQRHSCQSSPIIAKAVGPQWASCLVTRCLRQAATWHA